ncbi:pseudouridine synthase [Cellulomonas sp. Root137]|uniref:pseudouridine synthase n=1 Tax=Cellulomonas sp. Root137 TaxID=1736459 RepID=UPI0026F4484F|nr:pseudouridine synthase [Cellulomonas sp. Root137]
MSPQERRSGGSGSSGGQSGGRSGAPRGGSGSGAPRGGSGSGASRGGSAGGYRGGSTGGSGGGYRGAGGGEGYRGSTGGGEGYRGGSTGGSRGGEGYRGGSTGGSRGGEGYRGGSAGGSRGSDPRGGGSDGYRGGSTGGGSRDGGGYRGGSGGDSRDSGGYRGGDARDGGGYRGGAPSSGGGAGGGSRGATGGASRGGPGSSSRGGAPRPKSGTGYPRSGGTGRPRTDGASSRPKKPSRTPEVTIDVHDPDGVRLQKVLAAAGLGSRRSCEDLISAGRVTVDGNTVLELGVRVDPLTAVIHVDGMRVQLDSSIITIALNKPKGVVSTMHDPEGRPSIGQFVSDREERLFHVGRLDAETEGLILLTNDGDLANRLSHPSHGVTKVYLVQLEGRVTPALGARLIKGVELEDGLAKVDKFQIVQTTPQASLVEIELHEGRNRIVRRIFDEVGYPVTQLVRTQIGPIRLGDLKPGRTRVLSKTEVGSLMTRVGM